MDFQSPYASLGQFMFTPGQTAQAGSQLQNQLGGQFNPRMTLKNQASNTGVQRSLSGALKGQGQYDAARQLAPIANKFGDAQANAQHGLNIQRMNESFGTGMLGRTLQNINVNNSPNLPLAVENQRLDNAQRFQSGPIGQLLSGWF